MITLSYNDLKTIQKAMSYAWFDGRMDLNVIGIRRADPKTDSYDDTLFVAFRDILHHPTVYSFPITTEPGISTLKNPQNPQGTAILMPGQYRGLWNIGSHKGCPALVQVKPCTVIRDHNRDDIRDYDSPRKETGIFGINLHSVDPLDYQTVVGNWSAGCQVIPIRMYKDFILDLVKMQGKVIGSTSISYTLLMEAAL